VKVRDSTTPVGEKRTDRELAHQWNSIEWDEVKSRVNRLQTRIAKATHEDKWNLVKRLQYMLTHSYSAKLLAVRIVTQNRGKRTPGVDGELWKTAAKKMQATLSLTDQQYHSQPLRRVYIPKPGKTTKRPISIPTMYDRAMQALYALALQPIAETQQIHVHSVFVSSDVRRMHQIMHSNAFTGRIRHNGLWKEI